MIIVEEYQLASGSHPFSEWFATLEVQAALKIRTAVARMQCGNFSNAKAVGKGVSEYKIDYGPGYRIYFAKDGEALVILLGGGTKKCQGKDIAEAQRLWQEYKTRKKER